MRRFAALAAFACLLAAPSADAAQRVPFGFFGMSVDGAMFRQDVDQAAEFATMTHVGVESVITEVNWNFLQPHEDQPPDFSRTDRLVLNAARRGMRVMMNVLYAPAWAAVQPNRGASPPDPGKYATFLRALVQRYGPQGGFWAFHPELAPLPVRDWQVWNEPPSKGFWSKQPFQKDYVALLKASRFAIKVTDPGARVVLAGLTFRSWEDIAKIYKAGGQGLFDAVSLHPYTTRPIDVTAIVQAVRKVMASNGDAKVPVLITELSWPSAKGRSSDHYGYEVTPKEQAQRLTEVLPILVAARKRLHIERVYWFSWLSTDRGRFTFDYSGLRRITGTKIRDKPALAAYRSGVLALEGCKKKGRTVARCG
ncbi:MAG: endo,4-beta-xylanase [Solirubrobacterales bacterium]|nr:endo,4-beta-xylanase [Solirubrobacterales bacterium]